MGSGPGTNNPRHHFTRDIFKLFLLFSRKIIWRYNILHKYQVIIIVHCQVHLLIFPWKNGFRPIANKANLGVDFISERNMWIFYMGVQEAATIPVPPMWRRRR
ncbi:hypothetical protein TWF132_008966 [Orbilia oligospora]|nr:hypothetical protein TWF132_008966 [Orbilia oligospora]